MISSLIPQSPKQQKDVVLGVACNYTLEQLLPWIRSIKQTGFAGDVCLILLNASQSLITAVEREGVIAVPMPTQRNAPIYAERYLHVFDFLKKNEGKYRLAIFVDTRDAIFQQDPVRWLEGNFIPTGKRLVVSAESINVENEPTNVKWARDYFGEYFYKLIREQNVYNGGVIAGYADYVRDICLMVFEMMLRVPQLGADQIAYNILLSIEPWKSASLFTRLAEGWAVNSQVTSSPRHMNMYEPFLLDARPTFDGEFVRNGQGKTFVIVHQYDRVPEWTDYYLRKYLKNAPDPFSLLLRMEAAFKEKRFAEALKLIGEIKSGDGETPELLAYEAETLYYLSRASEAEVIMRGLLCNNPDNMDYKIFRVQYLRALGRFNESDLLLKEVSPDTSGYAHLEGSRLIRHGMFLEGMRAREFESGVNRIWGMCPLSEEKKFKEGDEVSGKRILLALEGGNGDQIAYARFAQYLSARGARVILGTTRDFFDIPTGILGTLSVKFIGDIKDDEYDLYIPAMSLIPLFKINNPASGFSFPYLRSDPTWKSIVKKRVSEVSKGRLKIGIHWRGNPKFDYLEFKTFPAELLSRFSKLGQLFSFQLPSTFDRYPFPADISVFDIHESSPSWQRTIAFLDEMDYVVTGDTAIAHIAGALGKETLLVSTHAPSVYWADLKEVSTWYPSVRVFRQPKYTDWEGAIDNAYKWLENKIG